MLTRSFTDVTSAGGRPGRVARTLSLACVVALAGCGDGDSKPAGVDSARAGTAAAKFCNNLVSNSGPLTLTLEVGSPPVKLTAVSGKCSVDKGTACAGVNAGFIPWRLTLDGMTVMTGASDIAAGEQRIFLADVDMTNRPEIFDGVLKDGVKCQDIDPFTDAGTGTPPPPTTGPGTRM